MLAESDKSTQAGVEEDPGWGVPAFRCVKITKKSWHVFFYWTFLVFACDVYGLIWYVEKIMKMFYKIIDSIRFLLTD